MADAGNIKFNTGIEKLEQEKKQCINTVSGKYKEVMEAQYDMIFSSIIERCKADEQLDAMVLQEHKTWGKCMKYCSEKAMLTSNPTDEQKRRARDGEPIAVPIPQETMFKWIEEYYRRDDKAEEEKAAKKKKAEEQKKKPEQKPDSDTSGQVKKPSVKANKTGEQKSVKKSKPKEDSGQMSLFDFLG